MDLPRAKSREARGMGGRRGCESLSSGLEKMRSSIGYADVFGVCQRPLLSRTVHRRSHTNRAAAHSTCMCLYTLLRHVCVSNCEPTFAAVCEGTWPWQSLCGQPIGPNPISLLDTNAHAHTHPRARTQHAQHTIACTHNCTIAAALRRRVTGNEVAVGMPGNPTITRQPQSAAQLRAPHLSEGSQVTAQKTNLL